MVNSFALRIIIWAILGYIIGVASRLHGLEIFGTVIVFLLLAPIISIIVDPHSHNWFKKKFLSNESRSE